MLSTDDQDRWEICIHEAGHVVAAIVLGGKCSRVVATSDGGVAHSLKLCPTDHAFVVASGPMADELLSSTPAPQLKIEDLPVSAESSNDLDAEPANQVEAIAALGAPGPSDDQQLAEWAISNYPGDPERWAPRVYWAREIARRIVSDHREKIIDVATELYRKHVLKGTEIEAMFLPSPK